MLCVAPAPMAHAQDPGRWVQTGHSPTPISYYQGITSDPRGNFYFDGIFFGLYRTDSALNETGRNDNVIPPTVTASEGYNHVGDLTWDDTGGGRVLLPLECFDPATGRNTCGTGSIGVADPCTLQWRYYVKLDPADIAKAMWAEVSPDGTLLWTSAGADLLAYRVADVSEANAAPNGAKIRPVNRLAGAVPPSGITGATFYDDRLFVAGQGTGRFQVWSIDVATGARRLEIERDYVGESEGLDTASAFGGVLHWQVQPFNREGRPPTFGPGHGTLVHFLPAGGAPPGQPSPSPGGCPPGGSPSAPSPLPPRTSFAIVRVRVSPSRGIVIVTVEVPRAGTLALLATANVRTRARGPHAARRVVVMRAFRRVATAGRVRLVARPTRRARTVLKRKGRLRARLNVTYTPAEGSASTQTRTVRLRMRKKGR